MLVVSVVLAGHFVASSSIWLVGELRGVPRAGSRTLRWIPERPDDVRRGQVRGPKYWAVAGEVGEGAGCSRWAAMPCCYAVGELRGVTAGRSLRGRTDIDSVVCERPTRNNLTGLLQGRPRPTLLRLANRHRDDANWCTCAALRLPKKIWTLPSNVVKELFVGSMVGSESTWSPKMKATSL